MLKFVKPAPIDEAVIKKQKKQAPTEGAKATAVPSEETTGTTSL